MSRDFKQAMMHRRSIYALTNQASISDSEIKDIIDSAVLHVPSAFNAQSARVVLLLGSEHKKVWNITKDILKQIVPSEAFSKTETKINTSFASGYGTILFFEDMAVVKSQEEQFPTYADNFKGWSLQSSGMLQFAIWTMLEDAGMGASLQHYNPLIDKKVSEEWNLPESWKLISQMPFGVPSMKPGDKEFLPLDKRVFEFK